MTTQQIQPTAIFPDFPHETPVIGEEGDFSPMWSLSLGNLFQSLQVNFSNEGILFPSLTAAQLTQIQSMYTVGSPLGEYTPDISGKTVFDTTNRVPKQFIILYDNATPPNITSASWLQINVMTFYAGNPNGAVAGALYWFCYDITNKVLYICTTAGAISAAVWTLV